MLRLVCFSIVIGLFFGTTNSIAQDAEKGALLTPARVASAIASAAATTCTPTSNWLIIFTLDPAPACAPMQ